MDGTPRLGVSVQHKNKSIYHLLSRAPSQCISISQVVDLNVFDIVTVGNIDVSVDVACTLSSRWRGHFGRLRFRFRRLLTLSDIATHEGNIGSLPSELEGHRHAGCLSWLGAAHLSSPRPPQLQPLDSTGSMVCCQIWGSWSLFLEDYDCDETRNVCRLGTVICGRILRVFVVRVRSGRSANAS